MGKRYSNQKRQKSFIAWIENLLRPHCIEKSGKSPRDIVRQQACNHCDDERSDARIYGLREKISVELTKNYTIQAAYNSCAHKKHIDQFYLLVNSMIIAIYHLTAPASEDLCTERNWNSLMKTIPLSTMATAQKAARMIKDNSGFWTPLITIDAGQITTVLNRSGSIFALNVHSNRQGPRKRGIIRHAKNIAAVAFITAQGMATPTNPAWPARPVIANGSTIAEMIPN